MAEPTLEPWKKESPVQHDIDGPAAVDIKTEPHEIKVGVQPVQGPVTVKRLVVDGPGHARISVSNSTVGSFSSHSMSVVTKPSVKLQPPAPGASESEKQAYAENLKQHQAYDENVKTQLEMIKSMFK